MTTIVGYRLRGEVGGILRAYSLVRGENWIGSTDGNQVVLPVRGVSRRHALVTWGEAELVLEDKGSRNGTLANGVLIQRTRLHAGDELRLGPVVLRLEGVEPGDTEVAIALGGPTRPSPGLPAHDTTSISGNLGRRFELASVESLLRRLVAPTGSDLRGALQLIVHETGTRGAALLAASAGQLVVRAVHGETVQAAGHPGLREALDTGALEEPRVVYLPADPPLRCAIGRAPDGAILVLCVSGEPPAGAATDRLLRIALLALGAVRRGEEGRGEPPVARARPRLRFPEHYVTGPSAAMSTLFAEMAPLVGSRLPVVLYGETGVGKEGLAHTMHLSSPRQRGPFVALNCAAVPAELLEAEMFGVGRNVATGVAERKGKFQLADKGTLFLDEIGEMPLPLQAKLLRALQEKEIQPLGSPPVSVDIRVVAATNADLMAKIRQGLFREDFYYRVAGAALRVPALRERAEDIAELVRAFVERSAAEAQKSLLGVTASALSALERYSWPGNVRELEHEIRRLVYLCPEGQAIDSTMLSPAIRAAAAPGRGSGPPAPADAQDASLDLEARVKALERQLIERALSQAGGNRTQAAKLLGVSRNGLAIKMQRYGMG